MSNVLQQNVAAIAAGLTELGIEFAVIEETGSGDEGGEHTLTFGPSEPENVDSHRVGYLEEVRSYSNGEWNTDIKQTEVGIEDAMKSLLVAVTETVDRMLFDGEGGGIEVTVNDNGELTVETFAYVTERSYGPTLALSQGGELVAESTLDDTEGGEG